VDTARGESIALLALIASLVASLSLVSYAIVSFQSMPDQIPTLANLWGFGEAITEKSLVSVVLIPSFNLVFAPFFAVMALLVAQAKRSVRSGSGGRSTQAQAPFRVAFSHVFAGTALSTCLVLGVTSLEMIKVWQGRTESLGALAIGGASLVMILYLGVSLFRIMWLGQGGARLESGSAEAPLTGALADNARWILGLWYVDRRDPAVVVEARWGIGYTMNLGNRTAQVLLTVLGVALVALPVLVLIEAGVVG